MYARQPVITRPWALGVLCLLIASPAFLGACEQTAASKDHTNAPSSRRSKGDSNVEYPYQVVATTAMIADIVHNVASSSATIQTLMGPGVDPHLYRPTRDDIAALLGADIVFYNGLNLEGKMSDTFVRVATSGKPVYAVTELLDPEYLLEPVEFAGHYDPHVWMDPAGWIKATEAVVSKLSEFDPALGDSYEEHGAKYMQELRKLDEYARIVIATIPADRRVLVTAHDAFNYFARAYGIEVRGIQGISTDSEAGLKKIESLIDLLVDRNIIAVFTESSVSQKNVNALVEGARAQGHKVIVGGQLFSDAMGQIGTYEGTYLGMIDHNVTTIVRALGGQAPEPGLNGKLRMHEN